MSRPSFPIRIVMQRRRLVSRWADEAWEAHGVVAGVAGEAFGVELMLDADAVTQYLIRGFQLELFRDEAEGYYLNVAAPEPRVFVVWRQTEEQELPTPVHATVSYNEAARSLDASENVDAVPMPPEILAWLGEYVEANYRPEPKKKGPGRNKPSFEDRH